MFVISFILELRHFTALLPLRGNDTWILIMWYFMILKKILSYNAK